MLLHTKISLKLPTLLSHSHTYIRIYAHSQRQFQAKSNVNRNNWRYSRRQWTHFVTAIYAKRNQWNYKNKNNKDLLFISALKLIYVVFYTNLHTYVYKHKFLPHISHFSLIAEKGVTANGRQAPSRLPTLYKFIVFVAVAANQLKHITICYFIYSYNISIHTMFVALRLLFALLWLLSLVFYYCYLFDIDSSENDWAHLSLVKNRWWSLATRAAPLVCGVG